MSSSPSSKDDFVTITTKNRKKQQQSASSIEVTSKKPPTGSNGASSNNNSSNISLRPRTMFAMKGRGRTESEGSAYRPQWSKDGEGFVSASSGGSSLFKDTSTGSGQGDEHRGDRRKVKVMRYTKEELLALHVPSTKTPTLPPETTVASEHSLPPVSTLPFDYEEIYKQWSLHRNRGRGRGRGNAPPGVQPNLRMHSDREFRGDDGDRAMAQKDDHFRHNERDSRRDRGARVIEGILGDDAWDDVLEQGESNEMDLSSMAEAAEKFRQEMDAMREELNGPRTKMNEIQDDLDAFDKKLEDAAATGQFDDSDSEGGQWDESVLEVGKQDASSTRNIVNNLLATSPGRELSDSRAFDALEALDRQVGVDEKSSLSMSPKLDAGERAGSSPIRLEVVDEWYYLDPQGLQQGPFKSSEMREWFEAGYFKPHLPIRFGQEGVFTALASQFAPGQVPFAALIPRLNDLRGMPADSHQTEQHLLEMQREQKRQQQQQAQEQQQQQRQQQMIQLHQQHHQQMMQFNQEEKIRLELQRLEIARQQQQTQLYQQQQVLRHQQEQQRQQQQMLIQQQNTWRSQRDGMLSAMGTFDERLNGSIRVDDNFRSEDVSPYQSDFRPQHKLNQQNLQLLSQNMFSHDEAQRRNQASWPHQTLKVTNNDNAADTGGGPFSAQSSSQVAQEPTKQAGPKSLASESIIDAWRTSPKVLEHPSSTCTDIQKEEMRRISNQSREIIDESSSQQSQSKSASFDKSTVQISDYHEKDVEKPSLRVSEKNTRTESNVWATKSISASASTISKSLKDIQKEEQREMLSKMSSDNSEDKNLAQMGVQLKMMLGVNSVAAHRTSSAPVATSVARSHVASTSMSITPVTSAWGTTATITKKNDSKSMRDILAEEERLALERAKANENAPTSSHWMNIVAGNKIAAAVIPKSTRSSLGPIPASVLKSRQQVRVVNGAAKPVVSKADNDASFWNFGAVQSADSGYVSTNVSNGSSNAFGKKIVSSEFMGWALKQLQTINSNADGTLLEYLASVEDPGEIREYLAAYLGSTPRVSAFATEFIQRKKSQSDGKKSQGEQDANQRAFEAGSSNKRGKRRLKSHKIDPSLLNYSVGS